ncbi:MAG: threonine synthase [Desulfurococcaceae archaeon]
MYVAKLVCSRCRREYELSDKPLMCLNKDLGRLDILYNYSEMSKAVSKESLARRPFNMWRYLEMLPVPSEKYIVSLGEGGTPLIKAKRLGEKLGLKNLYLKDETRNPTGSFKDRAMSVSVSIGTYFGYRKAVIASSGNAAASLAAYGAKAGLEVYALVPHFSPIGKISQLLMYGAKVVRVRWIEAEDPTVKLMRVLFEKYGYYPSPSFGVFNPYQVEGPKTISTEIIEQLNWSTPDQVFVPTGAGSLLTGVYKGFVDFNQIGLIDRYPRLVAVQPEGNYPLVRAWIKRADPMNIEPWEKPPETIATGLEDTYPWDGDMALTALYLTNGYGVVVSDSEIIQAMKLLASYEGIFAEPSGAAGCAGLRKALEDKKVDKDELVVVLVTGHGLKDIDTVLKITREPPLIDPFEDELLKAIEFYYSRV